MSCIRSIVAVSFLASIGVSTAVTAQEMISDTTARKQPLTTWGVQFEEFEYRYSDDDEELGVWNADAFYGTDDFKVRLLTTGEYEIEEQAYETLENQLVGQIPISKFFDAKAACVSIRPRGRTVRMRFSVWPGWRPNGLRSMQICMSARMAIRQLNWTLSTNCCSPTTGFWRQRWMPQ